MSCIRNDDGETFFSRGDIVLRQGNASHPDCSSISDGKRALWAGLVWPYLISLAGCLKCITIVEVVFSVAFIQMHAI